jgi:hypothetical protein
MTLVEEQLSGERAEAVHGCQQIFIRFTNPLIFSRDRPLAILYEPFDSEELLEPI